MDDLQRDIHREMERLTVRPKRRRPRRWTLLFVGAKGQVRRIERFAVMTAAVMALLSAAALAALSLYLIYQQPLAESRRLRSILAQVRQENRRLTEEKELLLAELVVVKETASRQGGAPAPTAELMSDPEPGLKTVPALPADSAVSARLAPAPPAPKPKTIEPAPAVLADTQPVPPAPVAVEGLAFSHDAETRELTVRFKLMNAGPESEPVSGRTFVVMETDLPDTPFLTLPRVPLENGRPVRITNGRYFSIARFNIVTFKAKDPGDPDRFRSATVFVFALSGELLLKRHFPLSKKAP